MRTVRFALLPFMAVVVLHGCSCNANKAAVAHPRGLGEACTANSQCESTLCGGVPGVDGGSGGTTVCLEVCNATVSCGKNEICVDANQQLGGSEAYACEPDEGKLCQPCTADSQCGYAGDACVRFDNTGACARDCSGDGKCPLGYACQDAYRLNGNAVSKQCVPVSGTCGCTPASAGQQRSCSKSNSFGTCSGHETCDPSQAGGWVGCDARTPAAEVCNGIDDDCNGQIDDGLGTVTCGDGPCQVTVQSCVDGGAVICQPDMSKATAEICDGIDNNCNGQIDEGFVSSTDPQNCGACGHACSTNHDTPSCDNGICAVSCDDGYADCDQDAGSGCETHVASDPNNCGGCGTVCNFANATGACSDGGCVMNCLPGYADANNNPADGCECHGTLGAQDLPDTDFNDANCDGIDGEIANAVFVDKQGGDDSNGDGGMEHPFKSVQRGLDAARDLGKRDVYLSEGTYSSSATVELHDGIGLYGGYIASAGWSRSLTATTTLSGAVTPLEGQNVTDVTVQLLSVFGQAASGAGSSAVAVRIEDSTNVVFDHVSVQAGTGADGQDGAAGAQGAGGQAGASGAQGIEDDPTLDPNNNIYNYFACNNCAGPYTSEVNSCSAPQGGPAGQNASCPAANGGAGGNAGWGTAAGAVGNPSASGIAGGASVPAHRGDVAAPVNANGHDGATATAPADGVGGVQFGSISLAGYVPADGVSGNAGSPGQGGGGGGGGGGGTTDCYSWGGGGGGGGAGGCGGQPGTPGHGGGASIGLWLANSQLNAIACTFASGHGGKGGAGGVGGAGGPGAGGGSSPYGGPNDQDDGSVGGLGGKGGDGAPGSRAGGGGGGPSIAVATFSSQFTPDNNSHATPGAGGAGGVGGSAATGQAIDVMQQ